MKAALVLIAVIYACGFAEGIVCPKGICSGGCSDAPTLETCHGQLVPLSSFCGCCATCVTPIPLGGYCDTKMEIYNYFNIKQFLRHECEENTYCSKHRCVPVPKN